MANVNEALKMAIEGFIKIGNDDEVTGDMLKICVENKRRIKEALESQEQCKCKDMVQMMPDGTLKPVFDSQEQEPVAWIVESFDADKGKTVKAIWDFKPMNLIGTTPLYTHPAQPLSDEEIEKIADETDLVFATSTMWVKAFARAIEQAHGIGVKDE